MDRTIIPNGSQPELPIIRRQFEKFCSRPELCLVYVTGRHLRLVEEAIEEYNLPEPDYAITDVGTKIYHRHECKWQENLAWQRMIAGDWKGKSRGQLEEALNCVAELILQEPDRQNDFKLSYYLPLAVDEKSILHGVQKKLTELGVQASLIWSIDEAKNIGLLDILPGNATKLHGIEFLQQQLGYQPDETIFAGDSGNDLPVLTSSIRSILVANARPEIQEQALEGARENGNAATLYLAVNKESGMDGNYAAGVLQGIIHFFPEMNETLEKI
jgi:sucrose-6F-phosphate phosphohydrolase